MFEAGGFEHVVTYIQSGNVVFRATGPGSALARRIETMLSKTFDHYQAWAVVRSHTQMRTIIEKAPEGFGADPRAYLYDVIFLKKPLTASAALKKVPTRKDVDEVYAGRGVLYPRGSSAGRPRAASAGSSPCPSTRA